MSVDSIKESINLDRFEIVKTGNSFWPSLSISSPGAGGFATGEFTTTIAHGLGYIPSVVAYVQETGALITDNYIVPSFSIFGLTDIALWITLQVATDATNLYIITDIMVYGTGTTFNGGAAGGFICQYYLMKERIRRGV